jgi:5-methylcytosine-specific restriction endonuclease McrA
MKVCSTCKYNLDLINFYKNKLTKDGLQYNCKLCSKKYKQNNKNRANYLRKVSRDNNPTKYKIENSINYYLHREDRLAKQKIYYLNNKEYFANKNRLYRLNNKHSIYLRNRARKLKLSSFKIVKQFEINSLLNSNQNKCFYCKVDVKKGINLHIDHKVPLSRSGVHAISNLVPSCNICNLQKGAKTAEEFLNNRK